jgi:hypothetical protein
MLVLDIVRMKLKSLIFECINVDNISFITVFILLLDMMCNEIEVLIFGHGGILYSIHYQYKFLYIIVTRFFILFNSNAWSMHDLVC